METIVRKIENGKNEASIINEASAILKNGGLVAFPTETVYGLGANALDEKAAEKIYKAKGRPSDNPLIVHIAETGSLRELAAVITGQAYSLAEAFWPGPLTMILNKSDKVPFGTTGGLTTVALRMPEHTFARQLILQSGVYIAAPSANTSGRPSPTLAEHVIEDLSGKVDMIIDGGPAGIGLESTIIDLTGRIPVILRPGYITKKMIEDVIGTVDMDRTILCAADKNLRPKAPGMKYKHYAPKGELTIYEGRSDAVIDAINRDAEKQKARGKRVGIIAAKETKDRYHTGIIKVIGSREDEASIAQRLYAVLREFDRENTEYIYSESFLDDDLGQAVMNRLLKAAGHHVVHLQ